MVPFMSRCVRFSFFFVIPFLGLFVSLFTLWDRTLHSDGLQQPQVSSVQPASLRLCWVYVSAISVCFWTPILLLGHPGSFRSMHDLKCMCIVALPHEQYTNIQPAQCLGRYSNLGSYGWEASTLPLRYFPSPFWFKCYFYGLS